MFIVADLVSLNNSTNRRYLATFIFVIRVIHRLILSELHLVVFGTMTISSDKRTIDISDTL